MLMRVVSVDSWGQTKALKREWEEDFPGGPGVESPPATAEDMGSFPGLRRSHMPRSTYKHTLFWLLSTSRTVLRFNPRCYVYR